MNTKLASTIFACAIGLACSSNAPNVNHNGSAGGATGPGASSGTGGSAAAGGTTGGGSVQTGGQNGGVTNTLSSTRLSGGTTPPSSSSAGTGGQRTLSGGGTVADAGVDRAASGGSGGSATTVADAGVDRAASGGSGGSATTDGGGSGGTAGTSDAPQSTVADANAPPATDGGISRTWQQIQSDFIDWRFGMFLHFGILTFTGSWAQANLPINQFNPTNLDCNQWADAAVSDHDGIQGPWDADLVMYEEPKGVFSPTGNTIAAGQDNKINGTGGNDWFWAPGIGGLMTASAIVDGHLKKLEASYTNFILNCPPNRQGQLDQAILDILTQVGSSWTPNANRAPLPAQVPLNQHPYMPTGATATSGTASNAIDGVNDVGVNTVWTSSTSFPQSLTLDLGSVKPDVGYFGYLPGYAGNGPTTNGSITSYKILVSSDNSTYTTATSGTWPGDGKYQGVLFGPVAARYVRLEADAVNGTGGAQATEVVVGARR